MKNPFYLTPRVDISERILNACFMGRNRKMEGEPDDQPAVATFSQWLDIEHAIQLLRLEHHFSSQKGQFASQILQLVRGDGVQVLIPYSYVRVLAGFQRASALLEE